MTTQPAQESLRGWLSREDTRAGITSALGGYLDTDEFLAHVMIHIQSKPDLAQCSVASQYQAIHSCAMLGLLPGFQQIALIPRAGKIDTMVQWQGYKALFERVPQVQEVRAGVVHISDQFELIGDGLDMLVSKHTFDPFDPNRKIETSKDIKGTYARFTFRDGTERYHFASAHYIDKCRQCAQTQNVWKAWFEQQALKTAFRSAYSRRVIPMDPFVQGRVERFLAHEDAMLGNDPRIMDPRIIDQSPERAAAPVSRAALLAQQMRPQVQLASTLPPREPETIDAPGETNPPAEETQQQPEHEQEPGQEPQGEARPQGALGEWLDMSAPAKVKSEAQLRKLYLSFEQQKLDQEVMDEINRDFDKKLATINSRRQAPLLSE